METSELPTLPPATYTELPQTASGGWLTGVMVVGSILALASFLWWLLRENPAG